MKYNNILETIGNTPVVLLNKIFPEANEKNIKIWMKLEKTNPASSIKDRIAMSMVCDAEEKGLLRPGGTILEATSGNTGIGLAMVGAVKGYKVILVMPESMSIERRRLMKLYGAELVLTPKEGGMKAAIDKSIELSKEIQNVWIPKQFENSSNPDIHYKETANEILSDFPQGLDAIIAGVGTGGHITGLSRNLKEKWPNLKLYPVEPEDSAVMSKQNPGPHLLQGIGAGFIPQNLDQTLLEKPLLANKDKAFHFTRTIAKEEGICVGISSGASLSTVLQIIGDFENGSEILVFAYDTGERYLTNEWIFPS